MWRSIGLMMQQQFSVRGSWRPGKKSVGADTAKWWRGHFDRTSQRARTSGFRGGSVERPVVGAAWRIPIPAQARGMVVGTLEVEWPPRHNLGAGSH